ASPTSPSKVRSASSPPLPSSRRRPCRQRSCVPVSCMGCGFSSRIRTIGYVSACLRQFGSTCPTRLRASDNVNAVVSNPDEPLVLSGREITKTFARNKTSLVRALDRVSIEARKGALTALVGPDGAGKTTFLRLAAGLMAPDEGTLHVLGFDTRSESQAMQDRISSIRQRFGLNEDMSTNEHLDLSADLHGVAPQERARRDPRLMEMPALGPFRTRLTGKLSGGMKQKLGLACTLVRAPELLLLDEPTVGVDPLSRRELWDIVQGLVERDGLSVVVSTSYMDEAERCAHVVVLHEGRVLTAGPP